MALQIQHFFHQASFTISYAVYDDVSNECVVIDPALDYDPVSSRIDTQHSSKLIEFIQAKHLKLTYILETHAHADHISSAFYLQKKLGGQIAIGANIRAIQKTFKTVFNLAKDFNTEGVQFDLLLKQGDQLSLGEHTIKVLETPGHTNDSLTYVINDHAFVGDTLFMPDSGSARCDFPGGDAATLYQSIQKIYALGDETKLYMCHDYQPNGRALQFITTVAEQKANNIQINQHVSEQEYVALRNARDATLANPKLIFPSLQCNIQAGQLPDAECDQQHYFKTPIRGIECLS
ncbi:MBL fold metallo-hydrolase [Thalassotalea ponticola]|uniref:MBL fold metallo-hydrolase n=1 Tax=Thalassotalea ponticola TaxID=1523392 RepID=UPI0025B5CDE2|nr:MBL fold metallo-hydrolase [Thalassotalea ponticola]MDN3652888.1 MBL fold metallo-hydrolase [Thalassotalea ponticola]